MKVLALEFSSPQRSVAVVQPAGALSAPSSCEVVETGERATHAFTLIEAALREAKLEREQIECLAIGVGPGSYTGIRAAIAVAQGWQLAREVKILAVSSVECLAAQARDEGLTGAIAVVIDAQRNEFYLAQYDLSAVGCREVQPLQIASRAQVQALESSRVLVGPELSKWFPGGRTMFPAAAMLGRLALGRSDFLPAERLEPIYLRETAFVKAPPARVLPG